MSDLQILKPNRNRLHPQVSLPETSKILECIQPMPPSQPLYPISSGRSQKDSSGVKISEKNCNNTTVPANDPHRSVVRTKETPVNKIILQIETETGHSRPLKGNVFTKPDIGISRSRPKSSRPATLRASFAENSKEAQLVSLSKPSVVRTEESDLLPPQIVQQVSLTSISNNTRATSRLSVFSLSAEDRENFSPNQRTDSCESLIPRRCSSTLSKYHERCFPKDDPALIIGSPYRIQSAKDRQTKSANKRPKNRHKYTESEFTNRESVVNIVYTAQTETEQDELSRARAETERDARALRSGGLSSGSFSQGFFNQTSRWAYPAQRQRRADTLNSQHNMAGTLGPSCEYPTVQEDECATSRYSYSRQSCSSQSDDTDGATLSVPGLPVFRPASQRSLLSSTRQTDSPRSESCQPQRTSSFLYQMVAFDNLADNIPTFVRQNVKKTGRMQTESFILRLNYLRRRRALGETSGTINNNAIAKNNVVSTSTASSGGIASPRTG